MTKNNFDNQRGSALLMTVLILAGIITVALNAASVVMSGTILSGVQERSTLAFYAAESGAEKFLYEARINNNLPATNVNNLYGTSTLSNNAKYIVDYGTTTLSISATSTGFFMETKRIIGLIF
jgi:Tfp pilus assembly protein PilX